MSIEDRAAQFLQKLYELTGGDITKDVDYNQNQAAMGLAGLDRGHWHEVTGYLVRKGLITGLYGRTTAKITTEGINVVRRSLR